MVKQRRSYRAYMLRLWQVRHGDAFSWRASLESARTGERKGVDNLEDLFAYLRMQTGEVQVSNVVPCMEGEDNGSY